MTASNEPGSGLSRSRGETSFPHRRRPCAECPWRRDVAPGQFSRERFEALADTAGSPGEEAPLGAPMFACHKSPVGAEDACAGWLAVSGIEHIGVRLAIATGRLDPQVLDARQDWPRLFDSFDEMAHRQAKEASTS